MLFRQALVRSLVRSLVLALALAGLAQPMGAAPPMTAGVGQAGRTPHPEYSVKLVFALLQGPYMAQVQVQVTDAQGG